MFAIRLFTVGDYTSERGTPNGGARVEGTGNEIDVRRIAKRVTPWILLGAVLLLVWGYLGQYQQGAAGYDAAALLKAKNSLITTPAVEAGKGGKKAAPSHVPDQLQALESVNMHEQPRASSNTIRVVGQGENVVLLQTVGAWCKVRDSKGNVGWVTASSSYTRVIKAK